MFFNCKQNPLYTERTVFSTGGCSTIFQRQIYPLFFKRLTDRQKKEALRPLFLFDEVRSILTEVPLAVHIVKVKCTK